MSLFGLGRLSANRWTYEKRNQRAFRPKKSAPSGSKGAQLRKHIDGTLGSGNLWEAVKLPPGEDLNEWLAVNNMSTGGPMVFKSRNLLRFLLQNMFEYLMDWIEDQLDDESIFPQKLENREPQGGGPSEYMLQALYSFTCEFGLNDKKELAPLQELIESIIVPY